MLIVGCGCRGRRLGAALAQAGHAVRGTSRSREGRAAIEAAGFEGVVADPLRLGTLLGALSGVSALAWLMGDVADADVHGPRFASMLSMLVDTPVRGLAYEAAGAAGPLLLAGATALAADACSRHNMPVAAIEADPAGRGEWLRSATDAVKRVLS